MIHRLVNLVQAMQCAEIAPPTHPENHDQAWQIEDFLIKPVEMNKSAQRRRRRIECKLIYKLLSRYRAASIKVT